MFRRTTIHVPSILINSTLREMRDHGKFLLLHSPGKEWKPFIKGIIAREKFLEWNKLWDNFIEEELRDEDLHPKKKTFNDDVALAVWMKGKKKKDLSKEVF